MVTSLYESYMKIFEWDEKKPNKQKQKIKKSYKYIFFENKLFASYFNEDLDCLYNNNPCCKSIYPH